MILSVFLWSLLQFIIVLTAVKDISKIKKLIVPNKLFTPNEDLKCSSPKLEVIQNTEQSQASNPSLDINNEKIHQPVELFQQHTQCKSKVEVTEPENENKTALLHTGEDNEKEITFVSDENKAASNNVESDNCSRKHVYQKRNKPKNCKTLFKKRYNLTEPLSIENDSSSNTHTLPRSEYFNFIFYNEIWSIILSLLFQDVPFLIVRMIIMFGYHVVTHMSIFFTLKNIFVICLYIYRIKVIVDGQWDDYVKILTNQEDSERTQRRRSTWRSLVH